jgi:hypothetical protein
MFIEDLYVYRIPYLSFRSRILTRKHKIIYIVVLLRLAPLYDLWESTLKRVLGAMRFEIVTEVKIVYDTG